MSKTKQTAASAAEEQGDLLPVAIPPGARSPKLRAITRSQIHPDPDQPREDADAELRNSIAVQGLLEPIIVRAHPTIAGEWMIVNGERRWRGCEGVLEDIPCIVRTDLEDEVARLAVQLVANTGKPMTPLEEARAFARMIDARGLNVADLADMLGRAKSTVAERLALLELGPWLALIESGEIVMSHAVKVLLPLRTVPDDQHEHAIAQLRKDYRYNRNEKKSAAGNGISLHDFERLIEQVYRPIMYPLAKSKSYGAKNPEFPTSKHDAECSCGGIKFDMGSYGAPRLCCGNPGWWRPLHRKALAAKKAAQPKSKTTRTSTPKAVELELPAGIKQLASQYGSIPKGVTPLTDGRGRWCTGSLAEPFDPADLDLAAIELVQWPGGYGESIRVGTKDAAAVKAAAGKLSARLATQTASAEEKFAQALQHKSAEYSVTGPGASAALPYVLIEIEHADDHAQAAADEVCTRLGQVLPTGCWQVRDFQKWTSKLSPAVAAQLLTELLIVLTEPKVRGANAQRAALLEKLDAEIAARPIPWVKGTKTKKAAAPAKGGKKSTAVLKCIHCGCTEDRACDVGDEGCSWYSTNPPICTGEACISAAERVA